MQVRLDDEATAFVQAEAGAAGVSAKHFVNDVLHDRARRARPSTREAPATVAVLGRPNRLSARKHKAPAKKAGRCPHPLLRRIGDKCALCGENVT